MRNVVKRIYVGIIFILYIKYYYIRINESEH
nr:MAG TPA: hypothetical protein [Caudoviricetes sp.]